ncbi:MAG: hypothetical protein JWM59_1269 [Verrucomicrobiales bacterium]|nr:hypothetical protein [Verrucomicrobiales bacterium]
MATMTMPITIEPESELGRRISRLSQLWNVSPVEVVRHSLLEVEKQVHDAGQLAALEALDWLQANATLTDEDIATWNRDRKEGWEETFTLLEKRRQQAAKAGS